MCGCVSSKCDDESPARESARPTRADMLAAAVQLVRISPDNNALELCEESLNELIKLNQRPLAVVGPAGTARAVAGGEFVLDDLQHLCKAMPSSSASLSEGLWLWPRTMKISGQEDNLVLLFTTGRSTSLEQGAQATAILDALAGVTSGRVVYLQPGNMDENMVHQLAAVASSIKDLRTALGEATGMPSLTAPKLLMLMTADPQSTERQSDPDELLEASLTERPWTDCDLKATIEHNAACRIIKEVFKCRACHVLAQGTAQNSVSDKGNSIDGLLTTMLTTAASSTPNFMQPRSLTGAQFAELLTAAVKVINQPGGVLTAVQAGTALSDARIQVAAEASRWMYEKKTSRLASCMKVDKAQKIHQAALAAASALFQQSGTYEDQETCTKAWSQVAEQLETLFAVQVEDIQSKQTQEIQQYENLLSEARTRSLLVFYGGGFINRLMDCSTRDQVLELMQGRVLESKTAMRTVLSSWGHKLPKQLGLKQYLLKQELAAVFDLTRKAALLHISNLDRAAQSGAQAVASADRVLELETRVAGAEARAADAEAQAAAAEALVADAEMQAAELNARAAAAEARAAEAKAQAAAAEAQAAEAEAQVAAAEAQAAAAEARAAEAETQAAQADAQVRAAAVELERLQGEQSSRMDRLYKHLLFTAFKEYKRAVGSTVVLDSLREIEAQHQAALSNILLDVSTDALLPAHRLSDLKQELAQQCHDVMDKHLAEFRLRQAAADSAKLQEAAAQAYQLFETRIAAEVDRQSAADVDAVTSRCQLAADGAEALFRDLASAQATYKPDSKTYSAAATRLASETDRLTSEVLTDVERNRAAEEQRRLDEQAALQQRVREIEINIRKAKTTIWQTFDREAISRTLERYNDPEEAWDYILDQIRAALRELWALLPSNIQVPEHLKKEHSELYWDFRITAHAFCKQEAAKVARRYLASPDAKWSSGRDKTVAARKMVEGTYIPGPLTPVIPVLTRMRR